MGKHGQPVDERDDDVFDIHVLLQVCTRLQEEVEGLQVELIGEHLREGRGRGGGGERGEEGGEEEGREGRREGRRRGERGGGRGGGGEEGGEE